MGRYDHWTNGRYNHGSVRTIGPTDGRTTEQYVRARARTEGTGESNQRAGSTYGTVGYRVLVKGGGWQVNGVNSAVENNGGVLAVRTGGELMGGVGGKGGAMEGKSDVARAVVRAERESRKEGVGNNCR